PSPGAGSAPAYPKPTSVIHSPSSSHADRVASEISTTPQPQGVYQHPRGKEIPASASTTTSAQEPPPSEESSLTPPPTYPAESVKSIEASALPGVPEEHPESGGPEETGPGAPEITGSGETPGGPAAVMGENEPGAEGSAEEGPEAKGGVASPGPSPLHAGDRYATAPEIQSPAEPEGGQGEGGAEALKEGGGEGAAGEDGHSGESDGGKSAGTGEEAYKASREGGNESGGQAPTDGGASTEENKPEQPTNPE
ncbi:hypothetical protein ANCDUO_27069, partial [Ancylostoma duodenale]